MNKREIILVPSSDHSYIEMNIRETQVVWNDLYKTYSEYAGDDYLEEGDEVVIRKVAV